MRGPWKVTSNRIDNITLYRVYKLLDTSEVDHSGNREYHSNYTQSPLAAAAIAEELNAAEKRKSPLKAD